MITLTDGARTIVFDDEVQRIIESNVLDLFEWIENAVQEKYRRVASGLITEYTNLNPSKMSFETLKLEASKIEVKSVRERNENIPIS